VVSGARGALKSEGLEAPFVGRDRELRLIKDLFHDSESDRPSVVYRRRGWSYGVIHLDVDEGATPSSEAVPATAARAG